MRGQRSTRGGWAAGRPAEEARMPRHGRPVALGHIFRHRGAVGHVGDVPQSHHLRPQLRRPQEGSEGPGAAAAVDVLCVAYMHRDNPSSCLPHRRSRGPDIDDSAQQSMHRAASLRPRLSRSVVPTHGSRSHQSVRPVTPSPSPRWSEAAPACCCSALPYHKSNVSLQRLLFLSPPSPFPSPLA